MTNFINILGNEGDLKIKNFQFIAASFGFVWICFHFTVIFFFWIMLKSILLTWLFLWIWNFIAFVLDIPIWVLLRYVKSKTMFIMWTIFLLFEWFIFFKFIFFTKDFDISKLFSLSNLVNDSLNSFLGDTTNLFLLLLCWIFYWVIKEIYDVTTLSYLMNESSSDNFAENLSKNNLYFWVWALFWLILSWVILSFNPFIAVSFLVFFIIIFLILILKYFDNQNYTISIKDIKNFKITEKINNRMKTAIITRKEVKEIFDKSRSVFVNPMKIKGEFNLKTFINHSKTEFVDFKNTLFKIPLFLPLIWSLYIIVPLWILDTFIATFQVDFLKKIIELNSDNILAKFISAYVLLLIIVIPVFITQMYFINLSKTNWVLKIICFWLFLSWISLIMFWLNQNIMYIILFWIWNSLWYAASFPLAQSVFSEKYNEHYSLIKNLKEIDSNASAWPLKMISNLANVAWLLFWSFVVALIWFNWFFIVYWLLLLWVFAYTIKNKDKIIL